MFLSLDNFKHVTTTVAIFAFAAFLLPESAQAQRRPPPLSYSGSPNAGETFLDFNLDTSVRDSKRKDPNIGLFKRAIEDGKYRCRKDSIAFCNGKEKIYFKRGNLNASPIISADDVKDYPSGDSFIGGVKYEAMLESNKSSDFIEFGILVKKPATNIDIINSLSGLREVLKDSSSSYVGVRSLNAKDGPFIGAGSGFKVSNIPESITTASLLGVGAIGAVFLLKCHRRDR
jgi:hypothetical protein